MTVDPGHDAADALTRERFAKMRPFGGRKVAPVDTSNLPPGPRWPMAVQSAALLRFRHRFVPWLHRKYGDVITVRVIPAGRPLILFTRPEQIKDIFAGDPAHFQAGKANSILGPVMGGGSVLLLDGADHKRARRLLVPAFSGPALRGYEQVVVEIARAEVAGWEPGVDFRSLDRFNAVTLEVILRVIIGVTVEQRLAQLRPLVHRTVEVNPAILLGWGLPFLQRFGPWRRTVATSYALDRLIFAEIRERRAATDLAERSDVLSVLIRQGSATGDAPLTDSELRDQLVTLLLAGHETTATALAWTVHEIGRDPALVRRARQAARDPDDGWLEAAFKEALRLHPVIPMVVRTLIKPATIGGVDLPAGVTVAPSILISHGRADQHPDPEVFRPERFLGSNPPTNTWIPFGGGVRRCLGAAFSVMEAVAVLREVFAAYDIEACGRELPQVRNITSVPRDGARIRVREAPGWFRVENSRH